LSALSSGKGTDEHNTWEATLPRSCAEKRHTNYDYFTIKGILWTKNWLQEAERNEMMATKETIFVGLNFSLSYKLALKPYSAIF
jgi:hypothetical protein